MSVVIPTRGRPALLQRSLASVAAQTHEDLEVVVVVDGPDAPTQQYLAGWSARPLTVVVNDPPVGGGEARNVGVRAATRDWIAFLDDDDEWLPTKVARQLADLVAVKAAKPDADVVGFTQLVTRSPSGDFIGPKEAPGDEPFSEYLFVRSGWFKGGGRVQTSTIMAPRQFLLRLPFDPVLPRYQETDWILRVAADGAAITMTREPLSIWYVEEARPGITKSFAGDWRFAFDWIRERRELMTPRAYAALMLIRVGGLAAATRDRAGARAAWREARRHGKPTAKDVALFAGKWILPPGLRRRMRARWAADRPS
ncbi:MAG TPA: glycosyltransferase family A protein [Candidatus Limnocylindria bacterium]|nr:glycosyltransferase family A protein [Candidatus Limnocylindria bacterium]